MLNFSRPLHWLGSAARWGFAGFWLLLGFIGVMRGDVAAGLFLIALGLLITPLSNRYLLNKLGWTMPTKAKVALGVALFIGFSMTVPPSKPRVESVSVRSTQSQAEKGAVKNNITKQEAEAAKQKAEAEEKKLQEEQKAKAEEDKQNSLASEYCSKRKQTSRYYPIPEVTTGADGKKEYKQNDKLKKSGLNLTQTDCRNTVDYLNDLSLKYPLVTIDIQKVIERKYWIGMNVAELSYSLGYPNKINATNYGSGESQQWVYYQGSYGANPIYIYVENSVVTSYQTF